MIGIRIMSEVERPVAEVAAAWVLEEEKGLSLARNGLLEAWLAESEDHVAAYRQARSAYDAVGRQGSELEMMGLREAALRARPERFGLPTVLIAASVVAVAVIGMGGWWAIDRAPAVPMTAPTWAVAADARPARYQTAVGERSTVTLPDGSLMTLNTASLAQVAYDRSERGVRLLAGQAMFTVAHNLAAPFRVYAGDRVITATGTAFEVYLDGDRVRVALLEGSVTVAPRRRSAGTPSSSEGEMLTAGEVLTASPDAPTRIRSEDVERLAGWRGGLVVFNDTPLSEAVREINRYTTKPIVVADAAAGRNRVSGTFRVGEPDRFARTMSELFPVEQTSSADGRSVLSSREQ